MKMIVMIFLMYYTLCSLIFFSCSFLGVLAWATVTTLALIVVAIKNLLKKGCRCHCARRYKIPQDNDPQPSPFLTPTPAQSGMEMLSFHTPPSQASDPESSISTPDTIVGAATALDSSIDTPKSIAPLINDPVSANTRAKAKKG